MFSFPRREGSSRLLRRRVSYFFLFRRRGPTIPVFLAGIQPFSVFLEEIQVFSFPRREGSQFSKVIRRRFSCFFLFEGNRIFLLWSGPFRTRREPPFPEPLPLKHPQEELRKSKGSNCLVPADLLLINDFSENERIPAFLFFFFPRTDPTFFLFHRRDGDWKG